jgi:hypothetical protein
VAQGKALINLGKALINQGRTAKKKTKTQTVYGTGKVLPEIFSNRDGFRPTLRIDSPDYLIRLTNGLTLVLEIKGQEDDQDRAKHQAPRRWASAVNHWSELGRWAFHVCRDPMLLQQEFSHFIS